MDLIQSILMGIVQGLSEFLPISSSAHLVFTSNFYKVFKGIETGSLIVIKTKDQAAKEEEFKRLSQIKAKEYKEKLKREGQRN